MNAQPTGWFGKYRELVIAIALFLVLDLGVLAFNFHATRQIEADTRLINAGGEMRMYTQQLTKALLTLQQETAAELPNQTSMAQITEAHSYFRSALQRLKAALAEPVAQAAAEQAVDQAEVGAAVLLLKVESYWQPMDETVVPLLATPTPTREDVDIAAIKFVGRNIRLMQLTDDLTRHLEATALSRASSLRQIQVGAILLALLNFLFIVVKFVRRLRDSDRAAETAREETAKILGTVHEGLFLVTRDGRLGEQHSASLGTLFGRTPRPGELLRDILRTLFAPATAETAEQYVELLFNDRIKVALMEQLNPLRDAEVIGSDAAGRARYLSFEFEQVREAGKVTALLVTVFDVSERVRLAQALAGAEQRAKSEIELLLGILDQDPTLLTGFVAATEERLERINANLQTVRSDASAYAELAETTLRAVHAIKGEAAALRLEAVAREAHACEDGLAQLRRRHDLTGEDFIPVAVAINALSEQMTRVKAVLARMQRYVSGQETTPADHPLTPLLRQMEGLAQRVAADFNKRVHFRSSVPRLAALPHGFERLFQEAVPQLVRNAVVHGIEPADERVRAGKPAEGTIHVEIRPDARGTLSLVVRDDGRGINVPALRRRLIEGGHKRPDEVVGMRDEEIVAALFHTGISTAETVSAHAGRGVGLNLVSDLAKEVGARLHLASRPNAFTEFTVSMGT